MSRAPWIAATVIALVVGIAVGAAVMHDRNHQAKAATTSALSQSSAVHSDFIAGCVAGGAGTTTCECEYVELWAYYGDDGLAGLATGIDTPSVRLKVNHIVEDCIS